MINVKLGIHINGTTYLKRAFQLKEDGSNMQEILDKSVECILDEIGLSVELGENKEVYNNYKKELSEGWKLVYCNLYNDFPYDVHDDSIIESYIVLAQEGTEEYDNIVEDDESN